MINRPSKRKPKGSGKAPWPTLDTGRAGKHGRKRRIFLVEDHPITRNGLTQLINHEEDLEVCGQAETVASALAGIHSMKPDLVLAGIVLSDGSGIELIKRITANRGVPHVLVVSMHQEWLFGECAWHAGASGYIMKQAPVHEVLHAIRQVLRGELYFGEALWEKLIRLCAEDDPPDPRHAFPAAPEDGICCKENVAAGFRQDHRQSEGPPPSPRACLSRREAEVLRFIAEGLRNKEIADLLKVSTKSVETYRRRLMAKLGCASVTALVRHAIHEGLMAS
ncbi:MAG: response regulator transcription factor [Opitutaceae bacterium]|nr:response regulator transcription factor [Opitutaceae bacterium]